METRLEIFFVYAHEDEILLNQVEKRLKPLKRQGLITGWYDREIRVGTDWAHEIDTHLNTALPKNARPVTRWPNRDEAFFYVAEGIRKAVEELRTHRVTP